MRKLFCLFGLLVLSLSSYAVQGWMWFNNFPWVYSHEDENWLYITPKIEVSTYDGTKWQKQDSSYVSNMGWVWVNKYPFVYSNKEKGWLLITPENNEALYAFGAWNKEWREFESYLHDWDKQYAKWVLDPEPYGGLSTLEKINEVKDNMSAILDLSGEYGSSTNISDLTPLSVLTNLTKLILFNNYKIENIDPLATLVNLIELNLTGNQIYDISVIGNLKKIENLQLQDNQITDEDLSILTMLPNLKILNLEENEITDYSPLTALTNLTDLRLGQMTITASQKAMLETALPSTTIYWPDVIIDDSQETEKTWEEKYEEWAQNPEPYGGLSVLQQIKEAKDSGATELILNRSNITDLTPLAELTNLTDLRLDDNNITDLSPLAGLTNLLRLDLWSNNITDITPLAGLTNLTGLWLGENNITDFSMLHGLTNLNNLWIDGDNISDPSQFSRFSNMIEFGLWYDDNIPDLSMLTGLSNLALGSSNISDLTQLAGLTNLKGLSLYNNINITDFSPLHGLTNLDWLVLSETNITDFSQLAGLTNLMVLDLGETNISDSQKAMLEESLPGTHISFGDPIRYIAIHSEVVISEVNYSTKEDYIFRIINEGNKDE